MSCLALQKNQYTLFYAMLLNIIFTGTFTSLNIIHLYVGASGEYLVIVCLVC